MSSSSTKLVVRLKYEMCKNFRETGSCKYGDRCLFAHGAHELISRGGTAADAEEPTKTEESDKVEENKDKVPVTTTEQEVAKQDEAADKNAEAGSVPRVNETTNDSSKLLLSTDEAELSAEKDLKLLQKEMSSGRSIIAESPNGTEQSCESDAILGVEDETQDHGENSTTLSSIEHNQRQPDTGRDRAESADNLLAQAHEGTEEGVIESSLYQKNFECEDEFKELLENLDIQNIEIKPTGQSMFAGTQMRSESQGTS